MIKLEDLKIGDYVLHKFYHTLHIIEKINKKSFTTTQGITIFEKEFQHYFVITEEEARASIIHKYNNELKNLNKNLIDTIETINNYTYYSIDTEKIENDIKDLLENIKEVLGNE